MSILEACCAMDLLFYDFAVSLSLDGLVCLEGLGDGLAALGAKVVPVKAEIQPP